MVRNEWIFNNTPSTPSLVVAKSKEFLMESIGYQSSTLNPSTLPIDHQWLGSFTPVKIQKVPNNPFIKPKWLETFGNLVY